MINDLQFLNTPTIIISAIIVIFIISQIIGEIIVLKKNITPGVLSIRKMVQNNKMRKKTLTELPAVVSSIQNSLNEINTNISNIQNSLDENRKSIELLDQKADERDAIQKRTQIIKFNDEILNNIRHTKEHFDTMIVKIDEYEDYCDKHDDFKNGIVLMAISNIKDTYTKCMHEHTFL